MSAPGLPIPPTPGAPPGGMPPKPAAPPGAGAGPMGAPMGGTGAASAPRPMMGNAAQSLTLVHTGMEAFNKALSGLPMGSEIQTAVMKAVISIGKLLNNDKGDKSSQIQALAAQARDTSSNPQAAAMQKLMGAGPGGAGGGAPPPTAPAPPG